MFIRVVEIDLKKILKKMSTGRKEGKDMIYFLTEQDVKEDGHDILKEGKAETDQTPQQEAYNPKTGKYNINI